MASFFKDFTQQKRAKTCKIGNFFTAVVKTPLTAGETIINSGSEPQRSYPHSVTLYIVHNIYSINFVSEPQAREHIGVWHFLYTTRTTGLDQLLWEKTEGL